MYKFLLPLVLILQSPILMAYEKAFEPTKPGIIEQKELPAGRLLESRGNGSYFGSSNDLFGPLFRYIQKNDIAMTTPVEARIDPGTMYFWVSTTQVEKASSDASNVRVIDVPKRRVVAHGARGSYNSENFEETKNALMKWIDGQSDIEIVGKPFAVYWDGPFKPWFMKTYEVQVEIKSKDSTSDSLKRS
ncbi:MAG: heme-binding protein [Opitutales bacterium]|jgi:effector-binding domain-containing protein|nr:heme-binding protein [Opitutales bacterium]